GCSRHRSVRGRWRGRCSQCAGSKPFACAVFPDGTLQQSDVTGKRMAARGQADAMRFSTLGVMSHVDRAEW
ncbi:MAG: hypothetical protein ACXVGQ_09485, partial [Mycobacteriaceae bacterium]